MSDNAQLKQQLKSNLLDINAQIAEVRKRAEAIGADPVTTQYADGTFILPTLLLAKAQNLLGLTLLSKGG